MAIARNTSKVVVVEVTLSPSVTAGVTLVGSVKVAMVDGAVADKILGPADAESLIDFFEVDVRDSKVVGIMAKVYTPITNSFEDALEIKLDQTTRIDKTQYSQ